MINSHFPDRSTRQYLAPDYTDRAQAIHIKGGATISLNGEALGTIASGSISMKPGQIIMGIDAISRVYPFPHLIFN